MSETDATKCKRTVRDPSSRWGLSKPCPRDAISGGDLCGPHLRGEQRSKEAGAKHSQERATSDAARSSAEAAAKQLAQIGIVASPHYEWRLGRYTGDVVLDPAPLLTALGKRGAS